MSEVSTEETWRDVVGFEGLYSVSNLGRVRSNPRVVKHSSGGEMRRVGKMLRPYFNNKGYPSVQLCKDGAIKLRHVHLVVLDAFVGPRPPGADGCHNDGNPRNARADNLRWDSRSGNFADMVAHGTARRGAKHHLAKLTADQVRAIRADARTLLAIATEYGVDFTNIHAIKQRKSWAWLE